MGVSQKELVDEISERVINVVGQNAPIKRIRKSQILSAFVGAVGFALFADGIIKLVENVPGWISLVTGFILMATTGLLLHNLNR